MIKISACVIVKNEAENIGRWLNCVRQLADEIIVVDTGSEDDTAAIAAAGGARVIPFQWCDDFAAAKNFALDQVHGEWVIFLDADEYFSKASVPKVREYIQRYDTNRKIVGIICRLLNIDKDDNNRFNSSICQVRIFRNLRSLRYTGRIHEMLQNVATHGRRLQMAQELEIYHTGYSRSVVRRKLERNLAILQQEIARRGEKEEDSIYLMDCYFGLEQYEKAVQYAHMAIESGIRFIGMETNAYERLIKSLMMLKKPREEILEVVDAAARKFPLAEEFPLIKGILYWEAKDYLRAEACFQQGEQLRGKADDQLAVCMSDNAQRLWPYVYLYMGRLAQLRFDEAAAVEFFRKGLQIYPYEENLLGAFWHCLKKLSPVDGIQALNGLYDAGTDAAFLARVLEKNQGGQVYLYYAKLAGMRPDSVSGYIAAGRFDAAAASLAEQLDRLYRLGIWSVKRMGLTGRVELPVLLPPKYQSLLQKAPVSIGKSAQPLVSVMIPTYNRPELFEKTLQSACAQTYENIEILVCDNSTDERTAQLMERYQADPRIRYLRNPQAKSKAENFQPFERLAQGEFLQWCMDDDILHRDKLTKMVACFQQYPEVTLVTSQRGTMDLAGNIAPEPYFDLGIQGECAILNGRETGRETLLRSMNFLGEPSAVLFRRRDLQHHYWQADCRGYKTISDVVMWLELLEKGDCAIFRDALSYYRRHPSQEGCQPDVIMLSRIEWYEIIEEAYTRGYFLQTEAEHRQALQRLYDDYDQTILLKALASASMSRRYEECMLHIEKLLSATKGTGVDAHGKE